MAGAGTPSWWRPRDRSGRFMSLSSVRVNDNQIAEMLVEAMEEAGEEAIDESLLRIIAAAKADVPVGDPALDPDPTVTLRDSFFVYWVGNTATVAVLTPYAVKQHESRRLKHPRGGRYKFLERHVTGMGPAMLQSDMGVSVAKTFRNVRFV